MKLLTKKLEERFTQIGSQGEKEDPIVIARFFYPIGGQTWYALEYEPEERMFFGYVSLFNDYNNELGYFSLDELESVKVRGLSVERDLYFNEATLEECKKRDNIT